MRWYHLPGSVHYSSRFDFRWGGGGRGGLFFACVSGGGEDNGLLGISRIFQQPDLAIYTNDL